MLQTGFSILMTMHAENKVQCTKSYRQVLPSDADENEGRVFSCSSEFAFQPWLYKSIASSYVHQSYK